MWAQLEPLSPRWQRRPGTRKFAFVRSVYRAGPNPGASYWAVRAPRGLVIAVAVRAGAAVRYTQQVPLHLGYSDPAFLSTIPGLALVM